MLKPSEGTPSDMAAKVILDLCTSEQPVNGNIDIKNAS
jgi:hypothetical protein